MKLLNNCFIPLLDREQAFEQIQMTYDIEQNRSGKVRNLTRMVANSPVAWQTTSRALQIYLALRKIDKRLRDLLCLYTSILNGCEYCIDDAAGEALLNGWSVDQLRSLTGNLQDVFSPSEVAALRYTEALTKNPVNYDVSIMEELQECFDTESILEITVIVSMKNFWNRFASGLRLPSEHHCQDVYLVEDLLKFHQSTSN